MLSKSNPEQPISSDSSSSTEDQSNESIIPADLENKGKKKVEDLQGRVKVLRLRLSWSFVT